MKRSSEKTLLKLASFELCCWIAASDAVPVAWRLVDGLPEQTEAHQLPETDSSWCGKASWSILTGEQSAFHALRGIIPEGWPPPGARRVSPAPAAKALAPIRDHLTCRARMA